MASASTRTWLSLDRWAEIMGINPLHFNGLTADVSPEDACADIWMQNNYQAADKVSREELAGAIRDAEQSIATYAGYNLKPDWEIDERLLTTRPANPALSSSGLNVRGMPKSVRVSRGHLISGGQKTKTLIAAAVAYTLSDGDGDGFKETCSISQVTSVTDPNEIAIFIPGYTGDDAFEVRPVKVTISGGSAAIVFKIWQAVNPSLQRGFGARALDADLTASFVANVDIYRVWNDPQSQLTMMWESGCGCGTAGCAACSFGTASGCLKVRIPAGGFFSYEIATWDPVTATFSAGSGWGLDPDQLRLWYLAGWQSKKTQRPWHDMDPYWEKAVAYYASGLLEREICGCDNVSTLIGRWKEDLALSTRDGSYQVTQQQLACRFGTTRGALYAWEKANGEGRRLT